jgi:transposase-like protein
MTCPFCEADKPELISLFGSQLLMSQYRCRRCGSYFEGLRRRRRRLDDGEEAPDGNTAE